MQSRYDLEKEEDALGDRLNPQTENHGVVI
jgi:hypothetical protein